MYNRVLAYKYMHNGSALLIDYLGEVNIEIYILFLNVYIHLFLVVLGLCLSIGFSLVAMSRGYSLVAVLGLLIAVISLVTGYKHWSGAGQYICHMGSVVAALRL